MTGAKPILTAWVAPPPDRAGVNSHAPVIRHGGLWGMEAGFRQVLTWPKFSDEKLKCSVPLRSQYPRPAGAVSWE